MLRWPSCTGTHPLRHRGLPWWQLPFTVLTLRPAESLYATDTWRTRRDNTPPDPHPEQTWASFQPELKSFFSSSLHSRPNVLSGLVDFIWLWLGLAWRSSLTRAETLCRIQLCLLPSFSSSELLADVFPDWGCGPFRSSRTFPFFILDLQKSKYSLKLFLFSAFTGLHTMS